MYEDYTYSLDDTVRDLRETQCTIGRFETWLRSHGYQPEQDPFMPRWQDTNGDDAADLVSEYLEARPVERSHREALLRHANEVGRVVPVWGDSGCGLALAG